MAVGEGDVGGLRVAEMAVRVVVRAGKICGGVEVIPFLNHRIAVRGGSLKIIRLRRVGEESGVGNIADGGRVERCADGGKPSVVAVATNDVGGFQFELRAEGVE